MVFNCVGESEVDRTATTTLPAMTVHNCTTAPRADDTTTGTMNQFVLLVDEISRFSGSQSSRKQQSIISSKNTNKSRIKDDPTLGFLLAVSNRMVVVNIHFFRADQVPVGVGAPLSLQVNNSDETSQNPCWCGVLQK